MIRYLSENLISTSIELPEQDALGWNGVGGTLDFSEEGGHSRSSLAVWHLLLDRWLPFIE